MRTLLLQCHPVILCVLQSTSIPGHIRLLGKHYKAAMMCAGVQTWEVSAACRSQSCSMRGVNSSKAHPCFLSW